MQNQGINTVPKTELIAFSWKPKPEPETEPFKQLFSSKSIYNRVFIIVHIRV